MDDIYSNTSSVSFIEDDNTNVSKITTMSEDNREKMNDNESRQECTSPKDDQVSSCISSRSGLEDYRYSSNDFECSDGDTATPLEHDAYQTDSLEHFASLEKGFAYHEQYMAEEDSENHQKSASKRSLGSGHETSVKDHMENYKNFETEETENCEFGLNTDTESYQEIPINDSLDNERKFGSKEHQDDSFKGNADSYQDLPVNNYYHQEVGKEEDVEHYECAMKDDVTEDSQHLPGTDNLEDYQRFGVNECQKDFLETTSNNDKDNLQEPPVNDYYHQELEAEDDFETLECMLKESEESCQKISLKDSSEDHNTFETQTYQESHFDAEMNSDTGNDKKLPESEYLDGQSYVTEDGGQKCLFQTETINDQESLPNYTSDKCLELPNSHSTGHYQDSKTTNYPENYDAFDAKEDLPNQPFEYNTPCQENDSFETEASGKSAEGISKTLAQQSSHGCEGLPVELGTSEQEDNKQVDLEEQYNDNNGIERQLNNASAQHVVDGPTRLNSMSEVNENTAGEKGKNLLSQNNSKHRKDSESGSLSVVSSTTLGQKIKELTEKESKDFNKGKDNTGEDTTFEQNMQKNNFNFQAVSALPWQRSAEKTRRVSGESLMKSITEGSRVSVHKNSDKNLSVKKLNILDSSCSIASQLSHDRAWSGSLYPHNNMSHPTSTSLPKISRVPNFEYMDKLPKDISKTRKTRSEEIKTYQDHAKRSSATRLRSSFDGVLSWTAKLLGQKFGQVQGKGIELEEPPNHRSKVEPLEKRSTHSKKDVKSESYTSSKMTEDVTTMQGYKDSSSALWKQVPEKEIEIEEPRTHHSNVEPLEKVPRDYVEDGKSESYTSSTASGDISIAQGNKDSSSTLLKQVPEEGTELEKPHTPHWKVEELDKLSLNNEEDAKSKSKNKMSSAEDGKSKSCTSPKFMGSMPSMQSHEGSSSTLWKPVSEKEIELEMPNNRRSKVEPLENLSQDDKNFEQSESYASLKFTGGMPTMQEHEVSSSNSWKQVPEKGIELEEPQNHRSKIEPLENLRQVDETDGQSKSYTSKFTGDMPAKQDNGVSLSNSWKQVPEKGIDLEEPNDDRSKVEPLDKPPKDDKKHNQSETYTSPNFRGDIPTMQEHKDSSSNSDKNIFVSVKLRKTMFSGRAAGVIEKGTAPPPKLTPLCTKERSIEGQKISKDFQEQEKNTGYRWEYQHGKTKKKDRKGMSSADAPMKRPETPSLIPRRIVDRPASPMLPVLKPAQVKSPAESKKGSFIPVPSGNKQFRRPVSASQDDRSNPVKHPSRPSTPLTDFKTARARILKCPLSPVKVSSKYAPETDNQRSQMIKAAANGIEAKLSAMRKGPNFPLQSTSRGIKHFVEELNDEVELLPSVFERFQKPRRQTARGPSRRLLRNNVSANEVY